MKNTLSHDQLPKEKLIPADVADQVIAALKAKGVELSYDPQLRDFSTAENRFATFPQLKILLKNYEGQLTDTILGDAQLLFGTSEQIRKPKSFEKFNDEDRYNMLKKGAKLSPEQENHIKENTKARLKAFALQTQKEFFSPRMLRSLSSQEQWDALPHLTELLLDAKINIKDYQLLVRSCAQSENLAKQERELAEIMKQEETYFLLAYLEDWLFEDIALILQRWYSKEFIKLMKEANKFWGLSKILEAGETKRLTEFMRVGKTEKLIEIIGGIWVENLDKILNHGMLWGIFWMMEYGQTKNLILIMQAGLTEEFILILHKGLLHNLIRILQSPNLDEIAYIYRDKKFWEKLFSTMKLPRKKLF